MQIIADLHIICDSNGGYIYTTVRKTFETDLVPVAGMDFDDSAWQDPREIKHVTMNPTDGYYHVYLGEHHAENEERCKQLVEMYRLHGWVEAHLSDRT